MFRSEKSLCRIQGRYLGSMKSKKKVSLAHLVPKALPKNPQVVRDGQERNWKSLRGRSRLR